MSTSSDEILSVRDLHYTYRRGKGATPALDGMDLSVRRGEIVGLLGPNGAGKTTTVRILTTILRTEPGHAFVDGHDVAREPLAARRKVAAVLQESAVETLLSTHDNLLVYGRLHGLPRAEARRRIDEVVELLDLRDQLQKRAQELSGGYKRRLQIAKALMVDSPVLFLDEATSGMDPFIKRKTMAAIRNQTARGRTVVLTTHLLDEAESLCDRMILMNRGKAMATGKLRELRALSRKMFRIRLSFADQTADASPLLKELGPVSLDERDGEVEMVVEGSEDEWIRKMALVSERHPLSHLEILGVNLEQIFLHVYGERGGGE